jgi:uncharacterized protein YyaL (SSP411 family)
MNPSLKNFGKSNFVNAPKVKLRLIKLAPFKNLLNALKPVFVASIFALISCSSNQNKMNKPTNSLITETSPYLLQHAHNPVNWYPWGQEALQKAKAEGKLLIISIGYSSCHWCHVMEHESFEDSTVAALMNEHFISIKIDREERPDLDNLYMGAVQLMTGRGGWPLNCVALPDGRPVWGGTYFPKAEWMKSLSTIHEIYTTEPNRVREYADELATGIKKSDNLTPVGGIPNFTEADLQDMVQNWKSRFDNRLGGPDKAPKFPLPNNYQFLLRYGFLSGDEAVTNHVKLTLEKMAFGGIYDQIGGGFSRYSVDGLWKVPHFEKMLYDNAQLISLYSEAHRAYPNALYKEVVYQTFDWLQREMKSPEGAFYSALDADSEGEEGKFYVWQEEELKRLIAENEWPLFAEYYNLNARGRWEHGNYILLRNQTDEVFSAARDISVSELKKHVAKWQKTLLKARSERIRPGLDDKALTSWNALLIKGLAEAHLAFGDEKFKAQALETANFIRQKMVKPNGQLWHTFKNVARIDAFLDDYATVIDAWLALYTLTGDENWLAEADAFTQIVLRDFDAGASGLFYFSTENPELLSRNIELSDNVIPASNSIMANNLERLGIYLDKLAYRDRAQKMAMQVKESIYRYGEGFSNWSSLMLTWAYPSYEVAICGPKANQLFWEFNKHYYPNLIFAISKTESELPLLQNRFSPEVTRIFICQDKACKLPVDNAKAAWNQIEEFKN